MDPRKILADLQKADIKSILKKAGGNVTKYLSAELTKVMRKTPKFATAPQIGKLYIASYSAKYALTLEYWDKTPLFMPISYSEKGNIIGINFHYLPPKVRQSLLVQLMKYASNKKLDDTTKLRLSYTMLTAASKLKVVQPTIHSYIPGRFKSKIVEIPANLWSTAMILPTQNFVGASAQTVYNDSMKTKGK